MTKRNTLTFLINGEDSQILSKGRVEKFFYNKKIHVKGGNFLKREGQGWNDKYTNLPVY